MNHNVVSFNGRWRIIWMEMWDQEYVDMEVPGYVAVDVQGDGEFHFGIVHGYFYAEPGKTYISSEWEGNAEMDEAQGEISAHVEEGELRGVIEFSNGDESEFRAVPEETRRTSKKPHAVCKA